MNQVIQSKEAVQQAEAAKRRKEQELCDYRKWRQTEEGRQYNKLQKKAANVNDVLYYTDTIKTLRKNQAAKAQKVDEAGNQVVTAQGELETAKHNYAQACLQTMKISEHKEVWMEDYNRDLEQKEQNELEEVAQSGPPKGFQIS